MIDFKNIADTFSRERNKLNLTVQQVSKHSKIKPATIYGCESFPNRFSLGILVRLCDFYGVKFHKITSKKPSYRFVKGEITTVKE